ncbi:hypothetical protein KKKH38_08600 [Helicobacter pylori]
MKRGNVIPGTLTQSKFVGRNGEECFKKLLSKPYKKYFENGVKMNVPKDYYRGIQKAAHLEEKRQYCKTIKAHTRPARVAKGEAIEARLNPNLSTAKDVTRVSHQAGMNAAQTGALIGGVVSLVTNVYECIANGKDPNKAIKHTALTTLKGGLKGGVISYFNAFSSSSLGGMMQSSANKIIKSLGKGLMPAMIVSALTTNATILGRYFSGKIDEVELLKQLVKANTTLISSGAMAVVGQVLIPIPVVGALIGGFVGATLSETCFNALESGQKVGIIMWR